MKGFSFLNTGRSLWTSVLMIVCGALLALNPDSVSVLVSAVLGWVLIVVGVMLMVGGFLSRTEWGAVFQGALFLLCGSWLHRSPLMIASVLGVIVGFAAVRQGWRTLKTVMGDLWTFGGLLAVLELIVGVRLILSPLRVSRAVLTVAGIILAACGVWDLIRQYRSRKYIPGQPNIIDAEQ